jgi:hypothetical protein
VLTADLVEMHRSDDDWDDCLKARGEEQTPSRELRESQAASVPGAIGFGVIEGADHSTHDIVTEAQGEAHRDTTDTLCR